MKTFMAPLAILLLVGVCSPGADAQDEKKGQLLVIWENSVMPSRVQQYEETVKKQVVLMKNTIMLPPITSMATSRAKAFETMGEEW